MRPSLEASSSALLEHTQDKIALVDESGVFRYVNGAADSLLGYDPEELVGNSAFEYMHPDERATVRECFDRIIESEDQITETVRYRFRAADGSWLWMESRFSNITDDELGGYVVSSRDVTEKVKAQADRETAEVRLREIANTISDPVWMFSADWTEVLFVSPAYEEIYGQSIETLREDSMTFLDTVHPDDVPCVEDAMERLSDGETVNIEYRVNPKQDYDTYVWVQGQPIIEDGEVRRIVGFSRDITDRHRRERQLAVMDNLLRHNLRNDLSVILGNADLIAANADETTAGRAELIRQHGTDLLASAEKQRTIIDLLTGIQTPKSFDVGDAVQEAVDTVANQHPNATIEYDLPEPVAAHGVAELKAAFIELLENAVHHDDRGDLRIDASVQAETDWVTVRVEDACPPIPEEEYRVLAGDQEMTDIYHSTGLGLWLVYWAVDLSDGHISFERTDSGNAISLRLRRAESA